MTTAKRQTLADFLYYSICQGQKEIGPIGYSPLPVNLVEAGFEPDRQAEDGRPEVDLTERNVDHLQQPDLRRRPTDRELPGRDRAAAAGLRQGRAGPCTGSGDTGTKHRDPSGATGHEPRLPATGSGGSGSAAHRHVGDGGADRRPARSRSGDGTSRTGSPRRAALNVDSRVAPDAAAVRGREPHRWLLAPLAVVLLVAGPDPAAAARSPARQRRATDRT